MFMSTCVCVYTCVRAYILVPACVTIKCNLQKFGLKIRDRLRPLNPTKRGDRPETDGTFEVFLVNNIASLL